MFGRVDHLEILASIMLSQPGNDIFQSNMTKISIWQVQKLGSGVVL